MKFIGCYLRNYNIFIFELRPHNTQQQALKPLLMMKVVIRSVLHGRANQTKVAHTQI